MIYRQQTQHTGNNRMPLFLLAGFLVVSVIGISVWFIRQRTVTNQHAAASSTLSFSNASQTVAVGSTISSNIVINPGSNQASIVKVSLSYDGSKLQANSSSSSFSVNTTAFPQIVQAPSSSCNGTQCILTATVSIGSDPTKAVQNQATVATISFKALASTGGSTTSITFNSASAVYSVATGDKASENVLSATNPLTVTVSDSGSSSTCNLNQSTCSWDAMSTATKYHYKVVEVDSGNVIQEDDSNPPQTSISFPSIPGKTYTCTVTAINICGQGTPGQGTSTCPAFTPTPTPSVCSGPGKVQNLRIICPNCNG